MGFQSSTQLTCSKEENYKKSMMCYAVFIYMQNSRRFSIKLYFLSSLRVIISFSSTVTSTPVGAISIAGAKNIVGSDFHENY
jgi:hypothetical protein